MNLFYQPDIDQGVHHLDPEETRHALKALRMKRSDILDLTDGKGYFYRAAITRADSVCEFEILEKKPAPLRTFRVHIALAPTKNIDRTEWFVEKAVEIGVDAITFMQCRNSERKSINPGRMTKIAASAMKQSGQAWMPVLSALLPFSEAIKSAASQKFIAHVDPTNPDHLFHTAKPGGTCLILIGPEGDFSPSELDTSLASGFQKVSLGPTRLRTETAALTACQILNLLNFKKAEP